jgi:hypothetical protein
MTPNKVQLKFSLEKPAGGTWLGGRASGKSYGIAQTMDLIVKTMPGSVWAIVGLTFKQMLHYTLRSTKRALTNLGYIDGKHYLIGTTPPKNWNWPKPHEGPVNGYKNCFYFHTGTIFELVSQDGNATLPKGASYDGHIIDQAEQLDKAHYDEHLSPTKRGNRRIFGKIPWHLKVFEFANMPSGSEAEWLLDRGNYYLADGYDYRTLMDDLIDRQMMVVYAITDKEALEAFKYMAELYKKVKWYKNKKGFLYIESNAFDNLPNIGIQYLRTERDSISNRDLFMRDVMNKRIKRIEGGFYAGLDRKLHTYPGKFTLTYVENIANYYYDETIYDDCSHDEDLIAGLPLWAGNDWGGKINCMTIGQRLNSINRCNIINFMNVQTPMIIDDLALKFALYYRPHNNKLLYLWYDNTGNVEQGNSYLTYAEQFKKVLVKYGWTVILKTKGGRNPNHDRKYLLWQRIFQRKSRAYPEVYFNALKCRDLLTSMELSPIKDSKGIATKDKTSERKEGPREHATHAGDSVDALIYGEYGALLSGLIGSLPSLRTT